MGPGHVYCGCHRSKLDDWPAQKICSSQIMQSNLCSEGKPRPTEDEQGGYVRVEEARLVPSFIKQILVELLLCTRHHSEDIAVNRTGLFSGRESQR